MIDRWLESALRWANLQIGPPPENLRKEQALRQELSKTRADEKARVGIWLANLHVSEGNPFPVRFRLANGAAELARGATGAIRDTWALLAYRLFKDLAASSPNFKNSFDASERAIENLGLSPTATLPFEANADTPPPGAHVAPTSPTAPQAPAPRQEDATVGIVASNASSSAVHEATAQPSDDEGLFRIEGGTPSLDDLAADWEGTPTVDQSVVQRVMQELERIASARPVVALTLRETLGLDAEQLSRAFAHAKATNHQHTLLEHAKTCRRNAYWTDWDEEEGRKSARAFFLASAAWNLLLTDEWPANRFNFELDATFYLNMLAIQWRYHDARLPFLLAIDEIIVRQLAPLQQRLMDVDDRMYARARDMLRAVTGTYLLHDGPDAVLPEETALSDRTPRTQDGKAVPREERAAVLLSRHLDGDDPVARQRLAFSLCKLCSWNMTWVRFVLAFIAALHKGKVDVGAWMREVEALRQGAERVTVARDPWRPELASERGLWAESLRALVGAVTDPAIHPTVFINGFAFQGRRVPTYQLHGNQGPFGLVKLDRVSKIVREADNFVTFAQMLHDINRPERLLAGDLEFVAPGQDAPCKALFMSWASTREETVQTLSDFVRTHQAEDIAALLERLWSWALRTWTYAVQRKTFDLRKEYALLSPDRMDGRDARRELRRLMSDDVEQVLGVRLAADSRAFAPMWKAVAQETGCQAMPLAPDINPLWFCAELSGAGGDALAAALFDGPNPLATFDSLMAVCHGDLHLENVLCVAHESVAPRLVLIDFDATGLSHICKDFARLEASFLCQLYEWSPEDVAPLQEWFRASLRKGLDDPDLQTEVEQSQPQHAERLQVVTRSAGRLRLEAHRCSQIRWPIEPLEYHLALLASLLPLVRYRHPATMTAVNRATALLLAAEVCSELCRRWNVTL